MCCIYLFLETWNCQKSWLGSAFSIRKSGGGGSFARVKSKHKERRGLCQRSLNYSINMN